MSGKKRVKFACLRCRSQKRRCDGGDGSSPCSNCQKTKHTCEYPTDNNRKPMTKDFISSLLKKIETLESVISGSSGTDAELKYFVGESHVKALLKLSKLDIRNLVTHHEVHKLDKDINGHVTFWGPTTFRHMSDPPIVNNSASQRFSMAITAEIHAALDWYFSTINPEFPLIHQFLFYSSLENQDPTHALHANCYVSDSLVNSIVAFALARQGNLAYKTYKSRAMEQVSVELELIHITQVQTLLILTILEMIERNETRASCFCLNAAAISNHLGLHIDSSSLTTLSEDERQMRERTFWCCFLVDRSRYPILGIGPYLDSQDVSTSLQIASFDDPMVIFREYCILLDICVISIKSIYSLQCQMELREKNKERQLCALRDSESKLYNWKMQLPQVCRLNDDIDLHPHKSLVKQLHILYYTTLILIHKPFSPQSLDRAIGSRIKNSSIAIINLCKDYNFEKCVFNYAAMFSLYVGVICCMFRIRSGDKRSSLSKNFKEGIKIIRELAGRYPIANVYYERIKIVNQDWGVPINFDEKEPEEQQAPFLFEDIDLGSFYYSLEDLATNFLWNV